MLFIELTDFIDEKLLQRNPVLPTRLIRGRNDAENNSTDYQRVLLVLLRIRNGRIDRVQGMVVIDALDNSAIICIDNDVLSGIRSTCFHGFGAEPETKAQLKENSLFAQDSQVWMKLKIAMPDSIGKAVQLILDAKGISQMELAMRLGVSRAAWRKWCSERMSLKHIVAICIALDVRADIGMEMVRLAGHTFQNNKEHNLLQAMMYETKDLTIARANEIMRQEKLAPLTEGKDEEIAC